MILKIYSKVDILLYETDKFKYTGSFMGDRMITLTAESPSPIQFSPSDYVDFRGERYQLDLVPAAKKISSSNSTGNALSYDLVFYPYQNELRKCDFLDIVLGGNNLHYTGLSKVEFYGDVNQLADRIKANLNRLFTGGSAWTITINGTQNVAKPISITDSKCWDALLQVQSVFGLNFTVKNRTITINPTLPTYDHIFEYGQGNGLYSIDRITKSDDPVITRLRCYGSSENIPADYKKGAGSIVPAAQYIPSLMLPDYETTLIDYIDSSPENIAIYGIREGIFRDDELKPSIKGMTGEDIITAGGSSISSGRIDQILSQTIIPENSTQLDFQIEIPDIGFILNEYLSADTTAMIEITDGALGGVAFQITNCTASDLGFILTLNRNKDNAFTLPNSSTYLSAGDHFVITGIYMPDLYVKVAESKLLALGEAYLSDNDHSKFSYGLGVDEIFMVNNAMKDTILEGDKLRIKDTDIGVDLPIIAQQLNISYGETLPKYEITLSDKPLLSAFDLVKKGIADSVQQSSTSASEADRLIRLNDIKTNQLIDSLFDSDGKLKPSVLETTITNVITESRDFSSGLIDGAILWKEGLTYSSTVLNYKIIGDKYQSPKQDKTLEPADPIYPRIDTFYVDIYNSLHIATGTPASNPSGAILNSNQLLVMQVTVAAGATTPEGLDVDWIYLDNTPPDWANSSTIDNFVTVDFNSTDAPLSGTKRIKTTINVPDTEINSPLHKIGDEYEGGVIFWIDPTSSGKKGLIVSKVDVATNIFWSRLSGYSTYSTGGTDSNIGTGLANTTKMLVVAACNWLAVKYCNDYSVDGYEDWYMPSILELKELWSRKSEGKLAEIINLDKTYWSSTERDWNEARCLRFNNGADYNRPKNTRYYVRAIRKFDDTALPAGEYVPSITLRTTELVFVSPTLKDTNQGVLSFNMKSSIEWNDKSALIISASNGNKNTGVAIIRKDNLMGYDPTSVAWQMVAIPMYNFDGVDEDSLDRFRFNFHYEWPNLIDIGLDDIRYQHTNTTKPIGKEKVHRTDYRFKELPDGNRTIFTTLVEYVEGTVELWINGQKQDKDIDYFEEGGKIRIAPILDSTDSMMCNYYTWK